MIEWKEYPENTPAENTEYLITDCQYCSFGYFMNGEWDPEDGSDVSIVTHFANVTMPKL